METKKEDEGWEMHENKVTRMKGETRIWNRLDELIYMKEIEEEVQMEKGTVQETTQPKATEIVADDLLEFKEEILATVKMQKNKR